MDYCEWAAEYLEDAGRVLKVIEKKKSLLNDRKLTSDARKSLRDAVTAYRSIYRELVKTSEMLRARGGGAHEA